MEKALKFVKKLYLKNKYARYGWSGNYPDWQSAASNCTGYDAENILKQVKAATLKVKHGQAAYERDGMVFNQIQYSWPLLANLLWIAGKNQGRLSVIDFGGALGSSYFQNRNYLSQLGEVRWSVVEQENFVAVGKKEIAGNELDFFLTVDAAIELRGAHDVLLLSCVLPYIEKPYELLAMLSAKRIPYIIIESTYFNNRAGNRLTVQKVPPAIYEAAYPAWFLDYDEVVALLGNKYSMVETFVNEHILHLDGEPISYRGFVMKLKE